MAKGKGRKLFARSGGNARMNREQSKKVLEQAMEPAEYDESIMDELLERPGIKSTAAEIKARYGQAGLKMYKNALVHNGVYSGYVAVRGSLGGEK